MKEHLLRSTPIFNKLLAGSLILMIAGLGVFVVVASRAATNQMYLSPATLSINGGSDVNISVRINSGSDPVNAVEADLTYDPTQLQYVSTSPTGTDFPLEASTLPSSGSLKLARATSPGTAPVVGDALVAIVTFHTLASTGSANINVSTSSAVVRSSDNSNILVDSAGSTLTLGSPATPTPTPSATPTPTPTPTPTSSPSANDAARLFITPGVQTAQNNSDFTVEVREDSGSTPVNAVQANYTYPTDLLQVTSVDETGSGFGLNASTSASNGVISIARGTTPGGPAVTAEQLIATVHFHALSKAGVAYVDAATDSAVVRAADSSNILTNTGGGIYTLITAAPSNTPTPPPPPTHPPTPHPTPHVPTPTPHLPPTPVVIRHNAPPPVVSGTVSFVTPDLSSDQPTEVTVDNTPEPSDTVDTTTLNDGEHVVSATSGAGASKQTVKQEVTVSNKTSPYQRLVAGLKTNGPTLAVAAALLAVVIGGIALARKLLVTNSPANRAIGGHPPVKL